MTKIKTPFSYLCIEDDITAEYAKTAISHMFCEQDLNEIIVSSSKEKMLYRTNNPFGVGYTDHVDRVLASQKSVMKLNAGMPNRKIDFLEIL